MAWQYCGTEIWLNLYQKLNVATLDFKQVKEMIYQIISSEQEIFNKLDSFNTILKITLVFQNESFNNEKVSFMKRDISSFFSPYSVTELGNTASHNYELTNSNFAKISVTEQRLAYDQARLAEKFNNISQN